MRGGGVVTFYVDKAEQGEWGGLHLCRRSQKYLYVDVKFVYKLTTCNS